MEVTDTHQDILILAARLGIKLDDTQLNIGGERSIMSPDKWVLTGTDSASGKKVVLKCAKEKFGVDEIIQEHQVRQSLVGLPFAEQELLMPEELFYGQKDGFTVSVHAFVDQDKVFTDHNLSEQFFMALHALECQESFHATTREHNASVREQFTIHSPTFYIESTNDMKDDIVATWPDATQAVTDTIDQLQIHQQLLRAYDGYLIHSDFVPHNFRIHGRQLYLLDFVSFRLGNKYESWARFINFMEIHNPELVPLLLTYIKQDRGETEYKTLRLLRVYKILFLLRYYARMYQKTTDDLQKLTAARLEFWTRALQAVLADEAIPSEVVSTYYTQRDRLRTPEEKARQQQFTWS